MQIIFLVTAEFGLRWMKEYYQQHPDLNAQKVAATFTFQLDRLRNNTHAGHPFDHYKNVRELAIVQSPFSILYTYSNETIYIIDIRDHRGNRSAEALAAFRNELKKRYKK